MPTRKHAATKDMLREEIERLKADARELRDAHEESLSEAKRLRDAAVQHEKTLGKSLKNIWGSLTGG